MALFVNIHKHKINKSKPTDSCPSQKSFSQDCCNKKKAESVVDCADARSKRDDDRDGKRKQQARGFHIDEVKTKRKKLEGDAPK